MKGRKSSIARCFFVISMYCRPFSGKLFAESRQIFLAFVWTCCCTPALHCIFRALKKLMDQIVCSAGKKTDFYRRFTLPIWVPCKNTSVAVWWAQFAEIEGTLHPNLFVRVKLPDINVCRQFWTAKDLQSSGSAEIKWQASQDRYLWYAGDQPLEMHKTSRNLQFWRHALQWRRHYWPRQG